MMKGIDELIIVTKVAVVLHAYRSRSESSWMDMNAIERSPWLARARDVIAVHRVALSEAGYVIVPWEPTEEMIEYAQGALDYTPIEHCETQAKKVYIAMIEAALK